MGLENRTNPAASRTADAERARPRVRDVMTANPVTTTGASLLSEALRTMRDHGIRHLPVMQGPEIVGVLSERDVFFTQINSNDAAVVRDAMRADPYVVSPDVPVAEVARTMLERKLGSALVMEYGRLAGIFTTSDALRALLRSA